jgi:DNA mismatch endonuclease, patch repair protein
LLAAHPLKPYGGAVPDVVTAAKRSQVMAAIRSGGNKATELKLITILRAHGITGWRRHSTLPGRPDFVFRRERLAVFVDGCFWHGCWQHCRMPKSRLKYWRPKIARNKARDRTVRRLLRHDGWSVFRIWEHALKNPNRVVAKLQVVLASCRSTA